MKNIFLAIGILFILTVTPLAKQQKPQFKVSVNLVFLDVEVFDAQGNPVPDFDSSAFVVKENGIPVEITNFARLSDVPVSLVVSLGTAFMPQSSLSLAKNAISQLIHLLKPGDEICLYSFDQRDAYLEQAFTRDRSQIIAALENIGVTSKSRRPRRFGRSFITPPQIGLGIDLALAAAQKGAHQRKVVLLIRDHPEELTLASMEHIHESGVSLIGLGFAEGPGSRLELIREQSGSDMLILSAEDISASGEDGDVTGLCRTIAHMLSSRYTLAYSTPQADSRAERHIEVSIPGGNYRILARRTR